MSRPLRSALVLGCLAATMAGCLNVQEPDLFLVKRTGGGQTLTLLVNDGDTIRCDNGPAKPLPDKMLLQARDLARSLDSDAKRALHIPRAPDSVEIYTVKLQNGTISFPDTAARSRSNLAQLELFTVQAAEGPCGLSG